jgi:hypothetical protein
MEVWDPGEEKTVLSQIKRLISHSYRGLKGSRYLLYPGILFILVFALLPGCSWPWQKEKVREVSLLVIPPDSLDDSQNTIACIKLQPECKFEKFDLQN